MKMILYRRYCYFDTNVDTRDSREDSLSGRFLFVNWGLVSPKALMFRKIFPYGRSDQQVGGVTNPDKAIKTGLRFP